MYFYIMSMKAYLKCRGLWDNHIPENCFLVQMRHSFINAFTCKPPAVPGVDPGFSEGGPTVMHHGKGEDAGGVQKLLPWLLHCLHYSHAGVS